MVKYIGKDKVINLLEYNDKVYHYTDRDKEDIVYGTVQALCKVINELPAADVQPVKHGKWEYEDTIGGMKHYHCTNCDNNGSACIADENQILWWEFCPRCGARMDIVELIIK